MPPEATENQDQSNTSTATADPKTPKKPAPKKTSKKQGGSKSGKSSRKAKKPAAPKPAAPKPSEEHAQATLVRLAKRSGGVSLEELAEARGSKRVGPMKRTANAVVADGIVREKGDRYFATAKAKDWTPPKAGGSRRTNRPKPKAKASTSSSPSGLDIGGADLSLGQAIALLGGEDEARAILLGVIQERLQAQA